MAHPKLDEVRAIAGYLVKRDLDAEVEGEARRWLTILRGSSDRHARDLAADRLLALLRLRGLLGARDGRPAATLYQDANRQVRWWAICKRISRWERVYRRRYRRRGPLKLACERVAAETGFDAETLNKRWQEFGQRRG